MSVITTKEYLAKFGNLNVKYFPKLGMWEATLSNSMVSITGYKQSELSNAIERLAAVVRQNEGTLSQLLEKQ